MNDLCQRLVLHLKLAAPSMALVANLQIITIVVQWHYKSWQQPQQPCLDKPSQHCTGCKWSVSWTTHLGPWGSLKNCKKTWSVYNRDKNRLSRIKDLTWPYGQLGGSIWHTAAQAVAWHWSTSARQRIARTRVGKRSILVDIGEETKPGQGYGGKIKWGHCVLA